MKELIKITEDLLYNNINSSKLSNPKFYFTTISIFLGRVELNQYILSAPKLPNSHIYNILENGYELKYLHINSFLHNLKTGLDLDTVCSAS